MVDANGWTVYQHRQDHTVRYEARDAGEAEEGRMEMRAVGGGEPFLIDAGFFHSVYEAEEINL